MTKKHESKKQSSTNLGSKKVDSKKVDSKTFESKKTGSHKINVSSTNDSKLSKSVVVYSLIFILIVGLFVGGYFMFNKNVVEQRDYSIYNGFAFKQNGKYWETMVERDGQLFEAPFNIHPIDLEGLNYSFDENVLSFIMSTPHREFILAIHPDSGSIPVQTGVNIARITGKFYGVPTSSALYIPLDERDLNATYSAPVVDCSDATAMVPIIYLSIDEDSPVVKLDDENPNCIIIGSNGLEDRADGFPKDIISLGDLLVYKMLKIMN